MESHVPHVILANRPEMRVSDRDKAIISAPCYEMSHLDMYVAS